MDIPGKEFNGAYRVHCYLSTLPVGESINSRDLSKVVDEEPGIISACLGRFRKAGALVQTGRRHNMGVYRIVDMSKIQPTDNKRMELHGRKRPVRHKRVSYMKDRLNDSTNGVIDLLMMAVEALNQMADITDHVEAAVEKPIREWTDDELTTKLHAIITEQNRRLGKRVGT